LSIALPSMEDPANNGLSKHLIEIAAGRPRRLLFHASIASVDQTAALLSDRLTILV